MSPELLSVLAQIYARQGELLAMQADNMQRAAIGMSMAWTGADFAGPIAELDRLAQSARLLQ
ncbi:hypothetical protein UFOVP1254_58 [uncultured Caudovirales phage]|uniref:Uncharacterized protein n=1 Tax=uncultured Caudovirales phage TaxID=2100421 RepID=A0A6J5RQ29_9CAUD|nr:hypothetical protein UFOVP1254_58 [uncultured Caudovirales phage]